MKRTHAKRLGERVCRRCYLAIHAGQLHDTVSIPTEIGVPVRFYHVPQDCTSAAQWGNPTTGRGLIGQGQVYSIG